MDEKRKRMKSAKHGAWRKAAMAAALCALHFTVYTALSFYFTGLPMILLILLTLKVRKLRLRKLAAYLGSDGVETGPA